MYSIYKVVSNPTVDYAAEELKKYLRMMMPRAGEIPTAYAPDAKDGFRLGLIESFGLPMEGVEIPDLDDMLYIDCDEQGGIIAGSNYRSILLAVYEYLRQNGCRWLFPGVDGEFIPVQPVKSVKYQKLADYRYRGQCNEGAEAQVNMLETIEFVPKIGMNTYMLEFDVPAVYYHTWYTHTGNKYVRNEELDNDTVLQWKRVCEVEIAKRGLLFHDMGHGWTADPFGIDSSDGWAGSQKAEKPVPEKTRKYLAMMGGKRGLFHNVPLNTNICMSNPEARSIVADAVVNYAKTQNNVDFLHIWLADASNNHCECEECQKKRPSDWYIMMLNEVDEKLTAAKLNTRIVFIVYVDSYWAPVEEKLKNPSRFTMLFAPITRTYKTTYAEDAAPDGVTPYVRNKIVLPKGEAENLAYYKEWRKSYSGDAFCYEYHFWWQHYVDMGYMRIARLVFDDIRGLKKWDLKGIIEDQSQRNYFPNGFPQYVYGRALYDANVSFEELRDDYFKAAYGEDWEAALKYLTAISDAFGYGYNGPDQKNLNEDLTDCYAKVQKAIDEFRPIAEANYVKKMRVQTVSWQLLEHHMEFAVPYAKAVEARAKGDWANAEKYFDEYIDLMAKKEYQLQRHLDVGAIYRTKRRTFMNPNV